MINGSGGWQSGSIHDPLLVKVTPKGEAIWQQHHFHRRHAADVALNGPLPPGALPNVLPPKLDRNSQGYSKMPLVEVVEVFGPHFKPGVEPLIDTQMITASERILNTSDPVRMRVNPKGIELWEDANRAYHQLLRDNGVEVRPLTDASGQVEMPFWEAARAFGTGINQGAIEPSISYRPHN